MLQSKHPECRVTSGAMIGIVFPGQGSQKPGMGEDLDGSRPGAAKVFDRVSEALGMDLRALCFQTDESTLKQTQNAQIALFTVGFAAWNCLQDALPLAARQKGYAFAGHSVGEYVALAASGALSLEDAARLVRHRGELMAKAGETSPGTMAAVLGMSREALTAICALTPGVVVVANDNCPGQFVISGQIGAVETAGKVALESGAKRVIPLSVSGAFHSPLMEEPARQMGIALGKSAFVNPYVGPVYSNVTSEPEHEGSLWPGLLERQLRSPVRWLETVEHMIRDGVTQFVECGCGDVLSGLIRRIDKSAITHQVGDSARLDASVLEITANQGNI